MAPTGWRDIYSLDFSDVVGGEQLDRGATRRTSDILGVRGITHVDSIAPTGSFDHRSVACKIQLGYTREIYLKSRIYSDGVYHIFSSIVWRDVYNALCPAHALNLLILNIITMFGPSKTNLVRIIKYGIKKDVTRFIGTNMLPIFGMLSCEIQQLCL